MKTILCAMALLPTAALAQHSPYAGEQMRDIKALSAEETKQYLSGAGMGYARAAELNQYPGPMHVLELAEPLKLSAAQRTALEKLMHSHKAEAREIGKRVVQTERELDELFRSGAADAATLRAKTLAAGAAQAEYRLAHLETHRQTRALLNEEQVRQYDALRGYAKDGGHRHGH